MLAVGESGSALGGAGVEGLAGFGTIHAIEPDTDLLAVVEDGEGIAVGDGDDAGLEGRREGLSEGGGKQQEELGGHAFLLCLAGTGGGEAGAGGRVKKSARPGGICGFISCN
jgi:hypothetical protein